MNMDHFSVARYSTVLVMIALIPLSACTWQLDLGDKPPVEEKPAVCEPENDAQFCARLGKNCDQFAGTDNCGQARSANCGSCTSPKVCGAHANANVCDWDGVGWLSGAMTVDHTEFGRWRNLDLDVFSVWNDISTWGNAEQLYCVQDIGPDKSNPFSGRISFALALTLEKEGSLQGCVDGNYDEHFKNIGINLVKEGRADSFIRVGWQDNDTGRWNAKSGEEEIWKACFVHVAKILRNTPNNKFQLVWNMNRRISGDVSKLWPDGDDSKYVDIVGVDFYDVPVVRSSGVTVRLTSEEIWKEDFNSTDGEGPKGLGTWIEFARNHEKKLAIPEWGLSALDASSPGDNSFFIRKMYEFFWENRDYIAYEALYNSENDDSNYRLYPTGPNPNAAYEYRQLFTQKKQ